MIGVRSSYGFSATLPWWPSINLRFFNSHMVLRDYQHTSFLELLISFLLQRCALLSSFLQKKRQCLKVFNLNEQVGHPQFQIKYEWKSE